VEQVGPSAGGHNNWLQTESCSVGSLTAEYNRVEMTVAGHPDYTGGWPKAMAQIVSNSARVGAAWSFKRNWLNGGTPYMLNCANAIPGIAAFDENLIGNGTAYSATSAQITGDCNWSDNLWACDESDFDDDVYTSWNPPACTSNATVWP
jgi:hypothetical protein